MTKPTYVVCDVCPQAQPCPPCIKSFIEHAAELKAAEAKK